MNEFEQKIMLTEAEYNHLMMLFGQSDKTVPQTNYYFDTDDLSMNRQNVTCRIRMKNGKYKATIKIHIPDSDCSTEIDLPTPGSTNDNVFTAMGLKLRGELTTERTRLFKNNEFEIELDKNIYLDVVDYELEIEYAAEASCDANDPLKRLIDLLYHEIEIEHFIDCDHDGAGYLQYLIDLLKEHMRVPDNENTSFHICKNKSKRFFEKLQK